MFEATEAIHSARRGKEGSRRMWFLAEHGSMAVALPPGHCRLRPRTVTASAFPPSTVGLEEVRTRLGILGHGLGGRPLEDAHLHHGRDGALVVRLLSGHVARHQVSIRRNIPVGEGGT